MVWLLINPRFPRFQLQRKCRKQDPGYWRRCPRGRRDKGPVRCPERGYIRWFHFPKWIQHHAEQHGPNNPVWHIPMGFIVWVGLIIHKGRDKWPPFYRWYFQMDFLEWKCMNFAHDFTDVCCSGSKVQQNASIGSDNGLAPIRRQAIIWTNDG